MPNSDNGSSETFLEQLRILFRQKDLRLVDVADIMGVSESTVKRYMSGKGVTLPVLNRLCAVAGVTLLDLSDLVRSATQPPPNHATPNQIEALRSDLGALLVYTLLLLGLTPERVAQELDLEESHLTGVLAKLDRLKIITLYPGNRVRILRTVPPVSERPPRVRSWIAQSLSSRLGDIEFNDPATFCEGTLARLTAASYSRACARIADVLHEVEQMSAHDLDADASASRWYSVYVAAFPQTGLGELIKQAKPQRGGT